VALLVPIAVGIGVMLAHGAPPGRSGLQAVAASAALLVYFAVRAAPGRAAWDPAIAVLAVLFVAGTLLTPGIDGVRRWYELGPARIHPSALVSPALLVGAARRLRGRPGAVHALLLSVQLVHVLQPDAGQATAFGLGALGLAAVTPLPVRWRLPALAYPSLAALAWLRPDPLPPAPFVEDIVGRALGLGAAAGAAALGSLGLVAIAPLLPTRSARPEGAVAAVAVAVYLAASAAVVAFGEFPVPLLGFGPSPLLGAYIALAVLHRRPSPDGA
jgi:cell division protein FtsW (lipid II flippase)